MGEDKFTIADLDEELRRRSAKAKASIPKAAPKDYANSDRYGQDGRRLYSAYDAWARPSPAEPPKAEVKGRIRLVVIVVVAVIAAVLAAIVVSALPR